MLLAERTEALRKRISHVDQLEKKENVAENAAEKARAIRDSQESLKSYRDLILLLGLPQGGVWPDASAAKAALAVYRPALNQAKDPSSLAVEPLHKDLMQKLGPLEAAAWKLVEQRLREEWEELESIKKGGLEFWKDIASDPKQIDVVLAELKKLTDPGKAKWLKLTADQLAEKLASKKKIVAVADTWLTQQMPDEVRVFLEKAKLGTAPLALFTDAVRQWLSERKQLDRVKLSFK